MKQGQRFRAPRKPALLKQNMERLVNGLALHQQGRIADARLVYADILESDPLHFDALHLSGLIAFQTRQMEAAVGFFSRAIKIKTDFAPLHSNYGLALQALDRPDEAVASYQKAIAINPNFPEAYLNRGLALEALDRVDEALASYDKALSIKPDYAEAYLNRGNALKGARRLVEAIADYEKAFSVKPDYAEAYYNHGLVLRELERFIEAIASYDKAIMIRHDYAAAYMHRGVSYQRLERFDEAIASYDDAIKIKPNYAEVYTKRGVALNAIQRTDEAIESFEAAVKADPEYAEGYLNLGVAYHRSKRYDDALRAYEMAISIKPDYVDAHFYFGVTMKDMKRFAEALESYDAALSFDAKYAKAHWNKSLLLLSLGVFDDGFALYEWRKAQAIPMGNRVLPQPLWLGTEDLQGRTILVHEEQGIGDMIQFCRYVKLLEERGTKVVFAVNDRLKNIMRTISDQVEIRSLDDLPTDTDFHCPLLSLPLAFKTSLSTIPNQTPYISANPIRSAELRNRLSGNGARKICGLSWFSKNESTGHSRSIDLIELFDVLHPEEYAFINLQYGDTSADVRKLADAKGIDLISIAEIDNHQDLDGFAALVDACDCIISIDNTTVHIAGALNKKTFVMLPYTPDWRWMEHGDASPWYPSLQLFRQKVDGDWTDVFSQVDEALSRVI